MKLALADYQDYVEGIRIPLRLGVVTQTGWPMVLSLWYLYEDGALFCATQESARIVSYLRNEPRCAFEIAGEMPPYAGIRGQAMATILPDRGEEMLVRLLERYLGGASNPLARRLLARRTPEVAIRLEPASLFSWDFTQRMKDSIGSLSA